MGSNRAVVLAAVAPRGVPIAAVQPEKRLRGIAEDLDPSRHSRMPAVRVLRNELARILEAHGDN